MPKLIDRTGHVYGRLTVIGRDETVGPATRGKRTKWLCECSCGGSKSATGHELASGDTRSCGCLHKEEVGALRRTHGMTKTPTYYSWQAAKERCHNPNNAKYATYGAVGIVMDEEWRGSFETFLADMGERPKNMTLDRIENSKGYTRDNCRWATQKLQSANKKTAIEWRGKRRTRAEIAQIAGIPRTSFNKHLLRLKDIDAAISYVRDRLK